MDEVKGSVKGPLVYLDYDQAELDAAYDQARYAANRDQVLERIAILSEEMRQRRGPPERVAYGPTEAEKLDIYRTKRASAPVAIFVHGGAWLRGKAQDYGFLAEMFNEAGAHYVALDFVLVQDLGGSLLPMIEQVRRGVAWVCKNAERFGGDPNRVFLTGQSSGAHLASCALIADWRAYGLPGDAVKGGLLVSGMYDLKPVRLSARSRYVKFDDATEDAGSAIRHIDRINAPLIVAYGTYETPEFQRQARDFAAAVKQAGKPVELIVGRNYNHFEMTETMGNPYALGGRAALRMMNLALAGDA